LEAAGAGAPGSRLRLDELLAELQAQLTSVRAVTGRVSGLLDAIVAIGSSLDLETVLRRITESAMSLTGARYGALGVVGDDGRLAEFVPVGIGDEEISLIHHWPEGKGILGLLISDPRPLRLADIASHPLSAGFPPGHPPMRSFLGVPVQIREKVFGNLYLTEKAGGAGFTEDDEAVLVALATAAGVAVENAQLYAEAKRQQRWLEATGEVSRRLLAGAGLDDVLELVTRQALELTGADLAALALPEAGGERLSYRYAAGASAAEALALEFPAAHSASGIVLESGEPLVLEDFSSDERVASAARDELDLGPAVVLPLGAPGKVRGVLTVARHRGSMPLPAAAVQVVTTFAAQAGVALELAEHRRDAERLAVLSDRDRIAQDLHDLVIQRLYATGMRLQAMMPLVIRPEVEERITGAVDDLDETIREIRRTIFELQAEQNGSGPAAQGLRERILRVAEEMTGLLGFPPEVRLGRITDGHVPPRVADDLLHALREALSNAARHAGASRVEVSVEAGPELTLSVRDNGTGIGEVTRRSGLANLAERAERHGGFLRVGRADGGGTELRWQVPLTAATEAT